MDIEPQWRNNRKYSNLIKIRTWLKNQIGLLERIIEVIYFKDPLSARLRPHGDLLEISHMLSNSATFQSGNNLQLRNVIASLSSPLVLLETGHIFAPNMPPNAFLSGNNWNQVRELIKFKGSTQNRSTHPLPISQYYYHFLFDELPRLANVLSENPNVEIIKNESQPNYVFDCLKLMKIPYTTTKKTAVHILEYVDVVKSDFTFEDIAIKIFESVPNIEPPGPTKIYIGRNGVSRESSALDRRILEILTPLGFVPLNFTNMDVASQVQAISNAKIIVGVHGGALSNIIFSKSCALLVEIFNHSYRTHFFKYAAITLGIDYISLEEDDVLTEIIKIISSLESFE